MIAVGRFIWWRLLGRSPLVVARHAVTARADRRLSGRLISPSRPSGSPSPDLTDSDIRYVPREAPAVDSTGRSRRRALPPVGLLANAPRLCRRPGRRPTRRRSPRGPLAVYRRGDHLGFAFILVAQPQHSYRLGVDGAARECWLRHGDQDVHQVPVGRVSTADEATPIRSRMAASRWKCGCELPRRWRGRNLGDGAAHATLVGAGRRGCAVISLPRGRCRSRIPAAWRFAERREIAGYSQETLARMVGVEPTTVGRWERGETCPQPWVGPNSPTP